MASTDTTQKLKKELLRCLLLNDDDKNYWLENADTLPQMVIEGVYKTLKEKNDLMETYMNVALQNDPDHKHVLELEEKIKNMRRNVLKKDESAVTKNEDAEALLAEKLANL